VPSLHVRSVYKALGVTPVLRGIDLEAADGKLVVLVGPSGCGKSTLLRTIAGLETPDSGTISIGDRDVTPAPPRDRDIAMVFQSYALYPHLTVRDNLAFGLKLRKTDPKAISERIREVSTMLGLGPLLMRYPRQLSGGQRQRVAMGRAIARRPALFLFDEPLSNLDAALRTEVRVEIKRLHRELGATMVYVTHDQVEAMTLADTLVVLNAGVVEQAGPPLEVYARPASRFVAAFMGSPSMNFLAVDVADGRLRADGIDLPIPTGRDLGDRDSVEVGVRPHDLRLAPPSPAPRSPARATDDAESSPARIRVDIEVVEAMGFEAYAHGRVAGKPFVIRVEGKETERIRAGEALDVTVATNAVHLFAADSGRAL
jgi:sn-glycerol 3-phosphate transport system ATP-binding protein/multiple sugar transport system ATP-binding protein